MAQAPCSALAQLQGRSLTFPSASQPTAIQRPGVAGVLESRQVRQRGPCYRSYRLLSFLQHTITGHLLSEGFRGHEGHEMDMA